jgi:hypothetical protein
MFLLPLGGIEERLEQGVSGHVSRPVEDRQSWGEILGTRGAVATHPAQRELKRETEQAVESSAVRAAKLERLADAGHVRDVAQCPSSCSSSSRGDDVRSGGTTTTGQEAWLTM